MVAQPEVLETDVLVVGGGGAGSRAALEARLAGARVILAVKGLHNAMAMRGGGATNSGQSDWGGFFLDPETGAAHLAPWMDVSKSTVEDFVEGDYRNIIQAGQGMADPKLVHTLVQDAMSHRYQLQEWGIKFHGRWLLHHGVPIIATLNRLLQENGVQILEEVMAADLLIHQGRCMGATGVDFQGNSIVIKAGAVILATGGDEALYRYNFHPPCVTGDGHAMAYQAGATLTNMEFGQFFLIALPGKGHPNTGLLRSPGAKLTNGRGEEFLSNYLPEGVTAQEVLDTRAEYNPFTTRDCGKYFDVATTQEIIAGRAGPNGGVFLDLTEANVNLRDQYAESWLNQQGIYPDERPLEILTGRHCAGGGLVIDEDGVTSIPGLYASGGEAAAGDHGADRLGGHMLASGQVFGTRSGRHAARYAQSQGVSGVPSDITGQAQERTARLKSQKGSISVRKVKQEIQQRMWEDMLVVRTPEGFDRVLQMAARIRQESLPKLSVDGPLGLVEALEIENMLTVAEMSTRAASMRTESRGGHNRMDHPDRDDANWLHSISIKKENGSMKLDKLAFDPGWKDREGDMGHARWG